MSRKFPIQKRQAASFGGLGGLITTYPQRPVARLAPVRRRSVSRRVAREVHWFSRPLTVLAVTAAFLLLSGSGWLGWQVQRHNAALFQESMEQDGLVRVNRDLTGQRERLLARDHIIRRAAALGLYPARPDQVRKIGGL